MRKSELSVCSVLTAWGNCTCATVQWRRGVYYHHSDIFSQKSSVLSVKHLILHTHSYSVASSTQSVCERERPAISPHLSPVEEETQTAVRSDCWVAEVFFSSKKTSSSILLDRFEGVIKGQVKCNPAVNTPCSIPAVPECVPGVTFSRCSDFLSTLTHCSVRTRGSSSLYFCQLKKGLRELINHKYLFLLHFIKKLNFSTSGLFGEQNHF